MHAVLGAEQAVGVLALGAEGRRLDAGLLPRADLEQLDREAAALGPAHHHPQHHLGPVLGVGAAGAGVDRDERVAGVVRAGEEPLLLERREAPLDVGELLRRPRRPARRPPRRAPAASRGPRRRAAAPARSRACASSRECSALTFAATSWSSQNPGAPICPSSSATRPRQPIGIEVAAEVRRAATSTAAARCAGDSVFGTVGTEPTLARGPLRRRGTSCTSSRDPHQHGSLRPTCSSSETTRCSTVGTNSSSSSPSSYAVTNSAPPPAAAAAIALAPWSAPLPPE